MKYKGDFLNDQIDGFGVLELPDGRVFEGNFKNGAQHGEGCLYKLSGTVIKGRWELGKIVERYEN